MTAAVALGAATLLMTAACAGTAAGTSPGGSNGLNGSDGPNGSPSASGSGGLGGGQTSAPAIAPGLAGKAIVLADNEEFSGDDAVTDASGTAYIGWIGNSGPGRKVNLCVLPPGATACQGGVSQVDSLGDSTAYGLRVLLTAPHTVTLVWEHTTAASESGPEGDELATTTSSGGALTAPHDVATAPSFGSMLDATVGPGGTIWVVSEVDSSKSSVQIRPGLTNPPVTLSTPYTIGYAQLRFAGSTPVLVIDKDGQISDPVSVASEQGGSWSAFSAVTGTTTGAANFGLASTPSGVRLIATVASSSYQPVVADWTGSGFAAPTLTGDTNACAPGSHDPVSDASGRLADVSTECGDVAVANLPDTTHATVFRFPVNGTFAGTSPQLTTTPSGQAWVTWSIESKTGDKLMAAPLQLPGQ